MVKVCLSLLLVVLTSSVFAAVYNDPTRPPWVHDKGPKAYTGTPVVAGIFYSKTRQVANINGKLVKVGDVVGNASVINIGPQQVTFKRGDKTFSVALTQQILEKVKQ